MNVLGNSHTNHYKEKSKRLIHGQKNELNKEKGPLFKAKKGEKKWTK